MIKKLLTFLGISAAFMMLFAVVTFADVIDITATSDYDTYPITDDDYYTSDYYVSGESITITSETPMDAIYICWETDSGEWTLTVDGQNITCGKNGYLHEYVKLPKPSKEAKITIKKEKVYIADIYGIAGDKPSWVQDWAEPYDKADILVVSTHSDDEILFLGGVLANYTDDPDVRVQVAYLCDFKLTGEYYRRHEQLNGLWRIGVRHYPQLGEFPDVFAEEWEDIYDMMDVDGVDEYLVRTIRRFKPQVLVTHDFGGEYGHQEHQLCAKELAKALDMTADSSKYPESASKYGTWDVPKAYFHIYGENTLYLDVHKPLANHGGEDAFDAATAAYKQHQSQQWMWFYVSDGTDGGQGAPYSITDFGLYRTTVGYDSTNDMLEHITTYNEQERQKNQETTEPETDENGQTVETTEAETDTDAKGSVVTKETESGTKPVKPVKPENPGMPKAVKVILIILGIILALLIAFMIVLFAVARYKKKKAEERRRRRAAARRRQQLKLQSQEAERSNRGNK